MKRKYFISYSYNNGFGQCDIAIGTSINSKYESIKKIIEFETGIKDVVILNYKRIWWWDRWI